MYGADYSVTGVLKTESCDRVLAALPFYHVAGLLVCHLIELVRGTTMVILSKFEPVKFLQTIETYKVLLFGSCDVVVAPKKCDSIIFL